MSFEFFKTTMPNSRPADYYVGCLDSCVFIDFSKNDVGLIELVRMSFDAYGCCNLEDGTAVMNENDSILFERAMNEGVIESAEFENVVVSLIDQAKDVIWEDALLEYGFIKP